MRGSKRAFHFLLLFVFGNELKGEPFTFYFDYAVLDYVETGRLIGRSSLSEHRARRIVKT